MLKGITSIIKAAAFGLVIGALIVIVLPTTRTAILSAVKQWLVIHTAPVSYSYAIKRAAPAVVNIYSITQHRTPLNEVDMRRRGLGSGVIMSANGIILTNLHVIAGADIIYVALQDGRRGVASIIGTDPLTDLAVLKIKLENLPFIPVSLKHNPQVGDLVFAIGNPYNLGQTITQGIISANGRKTQVFPNYFVDLIQTDAAVNAGNSGGALINSRGELVGINNANFNTFMNEANGNTSNGISFAIPAKLTFNILKELLTEGYVSRGSLGFDGETVVSNSTFNIDIGAVRVTNVYQEGPAYAAGLRTADVITKVNGKQFNNLSELRYHIETTKPGNTINFTVVRNGQDIELLMETVELGSF